MKKKGKRLSLKESIKMFRVRDNIFLLQRNFKNRINKYQVLVGKWHV